MTQLEFVEILKELIGQGTCDDVIDLLDDPPGRRPAQYLVEMSNFFKSQDENSKEMIKKIISYTADTALFGLFCIIDDVRTFDNEHGHLELFYIKEKIKVLLNDPEQEYLHDIFNSLENKY
ncbi:hypothetical protein [Volucribacter amazonae]|uniref:Uncharacterized protein n=1 Tax=Volucribacter amazonae TaxID=256731 RepID=A0A9X4PBP1_9PAST|nr:hypothetical protein [Volucribacter amazonae]MDG6896210.1 hypothetical protein [Volucribacter amazonae]